MSLMCVRVPGGVCSVRNEKTVEDLVMDGEQFVKSSSNLYASSGKNRCPHNRPYSVPLGQLDATPGSAAPKKSTSGCANVDPAALMGHSLKLQQWLDDKQVKTLQEKADNEAKTTKKMYDSVLETENSFVKEIADFLSHKDMLNQRKRELLHKKWTENVSEPIRREIDREINGPNYLELMRRKRELHKEYLEHTNKKGHVFLDTIAPDEYYALSLHPTRPSLLTAKTRKLRDPLLAAERERCGEDRILFRCMTGSTLTDRDLEQIRLPPLPLVPLGRHGTECRSWLEMPMGDIESPVRQASRRRMASDYNHSQFGLEDWARPPASPATVDREMHTQKKRCFEENPSLTHQPLLWPQPPKALQVGFE